MGSGRRGSESSLVPRNWWGLGGRAGGATEGGMERQWGRGTGRRELLRSYTLYGGGVLFPGRKSSSDPPDTEVLSVPVGAGSPGGGASRPEVSDTLQRLSEEIPLL